MKYAVAFVVFFLLHSYKVVAIEADSIATLTKNGQTVILYEVGAKETMYSIARKYNIPPKSIVAINPEIQANGLKQGQKIFVPYETARQAKSTQITTLSEVPGATYHTVLKNQTLYKISKMYKTTTEDIKKWNNLRESTDLKVGSKIIVALQEIETSTKTTVEIGSETVAKPVQSNTGYKKNIELGKADLFDTPEGNQYFYVLHRTIALGTVIKVRNVQNEQSIYGRVIGKLGESTDKSTIIKLSKIAFDTLGGSNTSIKVEIEYLP